MKEPLEAASRSVQESDRWQGSSREIKDIRAALRALIQWAKDVEDRLGVSS